MAQNQSQNHLLGEIFINRTPNERTIIENSHSSLEQHNPKYVNTIQSVLDIVERGDYLYVEMQKISRRQKKLYQAADTALRALGELQKMSEDITKEDVDVMDQDEKDVFKDDVEKVFGEMVRFLDDIEDEIGYPHPA